MKDSSINCDILKQIDEYIKAKIIFTGNVFDDFMALKLLIPFFKKINFPYESNELLTLLKTNTILYEITDTFVKKYLKLIKTNSAHIISDNQFLCNLIDAYCIINDIFLEEADDIEQTYIDDVTNAYISEINRVKLLRPLEYEQLIIRILEGHDEDRQKLVEHNLRYVVKIVNQFTNRGLEFIDLVQEGNIGLMKAAEEFDPSLGYKFTSYATWWIRKAIRSAISDKSRAIRLPIHFQEKIKNYETVREALLKNLDREPTIEEVAQKLKVKTEYLKLALSNKTTMSLNELVSNDIEKTVEEYIPDKDVNVEDSVINNCTSKSIHKFLENITFSEIQLVVLKERIMTTEPATLEAIAEKFNVTRERIRQIEKKVIAKILSSKNIKQLCELTENPKAAYQVVLNYRKAQTEKILSNNKNGSNNLPLTIILNLSLEDVELILAKLCEEDYQIVKLRYSSGFDKPSTINNLDKDQKIRWNNNIIYKLRKLAKDSSLDVYRENPRYGIIKFLNISKNEFLDIIDKFKLDLKDYIIIKTLYPDSYFNKFNHGVSNANAFKYFKNVIIPKLIKQIEEIREKGSVSFMKDIRPLFELLNVSKENLEGTINLLSENERAILKDYFDENYRLYNDVNLATNSQFAKILNKLTELLKLKKTKAHNNRKRKPLNIILGLSIEESLELIDKLSELEKGIIFKLYDQNLESIKDSQVTESEYKKYYYGTLSKLKRWSKKKDDSSIHLMANDTEKTDENISITVEPIKTIDSYLVEEENTLTNYIRNLVQNKAMEGLSLQEITIISLNLGLLNTVHSAESIAKYLGITVDEVADVTLKYIKKCKIIFNTLMENLQRTDILKLELQKED